MFFYSLWSRLEADGELCSFVSLKMWKIDKNYIREEG